MAAVRVVIRVIREPSDHQALLDGVEFLGGQADLAIQAFQDSVASADLVVRSQVLLALVASRVCLVGVAILAILDRVASADFLARESVATRGSVG